MRQANSTIKGYLYQFNKSILEILMSKDDDKIVLEGITEDIDILSNGIVTSIQCKYHEDKKFQMSGVASAILEMFCDFIKCVNLQKKINNYILYAYYADNDDKFTSADFESFLEQTTDKEIILKYFSQIYTINDQDILKIANKAHKSPNDKKNILDYFNCNRKSLDLRADIKVFWEYFKYQVGEKFDELKNKIIIELEKITDHDSATSLYYPNAFSKVALLSSDTNLDNRTLTKNDFVKFLQSQKSILLNRWTIEAFDKESILKKKKNALSTSFSCNSDVRCFIFSDCFLEKVGKDIICFLHEYIDKYFKKPKLQKQPIFIFGDDKVALMQTVLNELYRYQQSVNTGLVGSIFNEDAFINNTTCNANFKCKITTLNNITVEILEKNKVNQLYIIGDNFSLDSINYHSEILDVDNINCLRYLIGLTKTLEE